MRMLPRTAGLSVLLRAMRANAWTFAGSGQFSVVRERPWPALEIAACPMCEGMCDTAPMCHFYAGTFQHLIRVLIAPRATVREVDCLAAGGRVCRFEIVLG
jgi:divinyl protochlorophyllide a 8-vinyl-reductase